MPIDLFAQQPDQTREPVDLFENQEKPQETLAAKAFSFASQNPLKIAEDVSNLQDKVSLGGAKGAYNFGADIVNMLPGVNLPEFKYAQQDLPTKVGMAIGNTAMFLGTSEIGGDLLKIPKIVDYLKATSDGVPFVGKLAKAFLSAPVRSAAGNAFLGAATNPDDRKAGAALGAGLSGAADVATGLPKAISYMKGLSRDSKLMLDDPSVLKTAQNRLKTAEKAGISNLPAGALTGSPAIQQQEQLIMGSGGKPAGMLKNKIAEVNNDIYNKANDMINTLGLSKGDLDHLSQNPNDFGEKIQSALGNNQKEASKKISNLYDIAASAPGSEEKIDVNPIKTKLNDINQNYSDIKFTPAVKSHIDTINDSMSGDLRQKMQDIFTDPSSTNLDKSYAKQRLDSDGLSIKQTNEFLKSINKQIGSTSDLPTLKALNELGSTVRSSIDGESDNINNPSRNLFNIARNAYRENKGIFDQKDVIDDLLTKKAVNTQKIDPKLVVDKIFNSANTPTNIDKMQEAFNYAIDSNGNRVANPDGQNLWNTLKALKLHKMLADSTEAVDGVPVLNYSKLMKNYNAIGKESFDKLIGDKNISDDFGKLMETLSYMQEKPSSVIKEKVPLVVKHSASLLSKIPIVGGFSDVIGNILSHTRDQKWVESNLELSNAIKNNPKLTGIIKPNAGNLSTEQRSKYIKTLIKGSMLGAILPHTTDTQNEQENQ